MCAERNIYSPSVFSALVVVVFIVNAASTASTATITLPGTKSTLTGIVTSSRHKRAPGWGKRAPGWGKRAPGWGKRQSGNTDFFDQTDSDYEMTNRGEAFKEALFLSGVDLPAGRGDLDWDKRAPGWGKRCCSEIEFSRNWATGPSNVIPVWDQRNADNDIDDLTEMGKRAPGWGKRAPGWGKRAPGWGKRAPGWGKRNYIDSDTDGTEANTMSNVWENNISDDQNIFENSDGFPELSNSNAGLRTASFITGDTLSTEKRAPGWGKRAPGWGKRNFQFETNYNDSELDKRAPGWGKRAPGWGKRAPGWGKRNYETEMDTTEADKRAPGWGKRTITRVKRASQSTTATSGESCKRLQRLENDYIARVKELAARRSAECGNVEVTNEAIRK